MNEAEAKELEARSPGWKAVRDETGEWAMCKEVTDPKDIELFRRAAAHMQPGVTYIAKPEGSERDGKN